MNTIQDRCKAFIEKAKNIHCNENLDYSKVVYINNKTKVIIIDRDLDENGNEYGEFQITPSNLLKGRSHPKKRGKKISNKKKFTTEHIISLFKEKHENEKLYYSLVEYNGMDIPVAIICKEVNDEGVEYGLFYQTPRIHLKGCTHPKLSIDKNSKKQIKTTEYFINKSKKVHGDLYDYSQSNYLGNDKPIAIICPKHGLFWMTPENHYYGKGFPKCGFHLSNGENEIIDFLKNNVNGIIQGDRSVLSGLELDIYIPSKQIAIEYNGLRWHSEEFGKDKWYHLNKTLMCEEKNINLIHIFEDEYLKNKELVLNKISHILKVKKIPPKSWAENVL